MKLAPIALACAALLTPGFSHGQAAASGQPDVAHRGAEGNEQMGIGAAAAQDAQALARAQDGWWTQALKTRDQRLAWWRDARFGAFVHWGPYSVLGGSWQGKPGGSYAEHIMRVAKIPRDTYFKEVGGQFHPDAFDAKAWVKLMKSAGMRYIIITAKHHDGFAIWPSSVSDFNIAKASGFQRDPLAELVTAARAEGLRVGFYYSHAFDWEDPDAPGNDWDHDNPGGDRKLHGGADWWNTYPAFLDNTERYVDTKAIPQLRELIDRYHPDILWFDTPGKLPFFQQAKIVEAVRKAGPDIVINGRAARSAQANLGDYQNTADRPAEVRPTAGDWEAIPTTNESYGFSALDHSHKTPKSLIQLLVKSVAKGGNILLNIGPRGDGTIDPPDVKILQGIARWMAVNGESIHGAGRTPLDRQAWGDSTLKGSTLYLHVFRWPQDGSLRVAGLQGPVKKAYLLGDPKRAALPLTKAADGDVVIATPKTAPDADDSVVVVETEGAPRATTGRLIDLSYGANQLLAFDAAALGKGFTYGDGKTNRYNVDGLEAPGNSLAWQVRAPHAQSVRVRLRYATTGLDGSAPDAAISVHYQGQTLRVRLPASPSQTPVAELDLGVLNLSTNLAPLQLSAQGLGEAKLSVFELLLERP